MFQPVKQKHNRVLIVGGGESLVGFDFDQIIDFDGVIITVNNVISYLPRADYWITVDLAKPQKALEKLRRDCYYYAGYPFYSDGYEMVNGVHYLDKVVPKKGGSYELQEEKDSITGAVDSIYGALNLAYHFEAKELIILGMDCYGFGHWYDLDSPYNAYGLDDWVEDRISGIAIRYKDCLKQFEDRGTRIINGSAESKIDCFERMSPQEAINYFDK